MRVGNLLADKHTIPVEINGVDTDSCLLMGYIRSSFLNYMTKAVYPAIVPFWALLPWMSSNNLYPES
ncbi:hypothetical protein, partial [Listeria monocytogenes]|uniref:hypothetical protein n=1 Tax=Listeria monocytogenes TaxID=1639 RepID=UPI00122D8E84